MKRAFFLIAVFLVSIFFAPSSLALATEERVFTDLQDKVNKIIAFLSDRYNKDGVENAGWRLSVKKELDNFFDFRSMGLLVIKKEKHRFNGREEEFYPLFAAHVEKFLVGFLKRARITKVHYPPNRSKILRVSSGENLEVGAKLSTILSVQLTILHGDYEVDFFFHEIEDGAWKVFDLTAAGVNAVSFFRGEFRIMKKDPALLIEALKKQ